METSRPNVRAEVSRIAAALREFCGGTDSRIRASAPICNAGLNGEETSRVRRDIFASGDRAALLKSTVLGKHAERPYDAAAINA